MKARGIARIIVVVKNLEEGMAFFSKLLGCKFNVQGEDAEAYGLRVALSYDGQIEMVSPKPGADTPWSRSVTKDLEEHGEGLRQVIFGVDDIEEGRKRAEELGLNIEHTVEYGLEEIDRYYGGRYAKYKEYFIEQKNTHGVHLILAQLDPRPGRIEPTN